MAICLMYHNIIPSEAERGRFFEQHRPYAVTRRRFEGHIAAGREAGWRFLSPDELFTDRVKEKKALLLTFDDPWDNRQAEEVLAAEGISGVFFLNSGLIGRPLMMGEDDVRRMSAAGMEIGSHGVTHDFFSSLSTDELRRALFDSKAALERLTGREVRFLSAPGGRYDRRTVRLSREAGYRAFFVSRPGYLPDGRGRFVLNRISITADITGKRFSRFLAGPARHIAWHAARYQYARMLRPFTRKSVRQPT